VNEQQPVPTIMRDGSIPAAASSSSSVARSSSESEFASLVVPNTASPQFCESNHWQCAMKRSLSGEKSARNGVRTGARTPRIRLPWIMVSPLKVDDNAAIRNSDEESPQPGHTCATNDKV
jgi:hypothetical protein